MTLIHQATLGIHLLLSDLSRFRFNPRVSNNTRGSKRTTRHNDTSQTNHEKGMGSITTRHPRGAPRDCYNQQWFVCLLRRVLAKIHCSNTQAVDVDARNCTSYMLYMLQHLHTIMSPAEQRSLADHLASTTLTTASLSSHLTATNVMYRLPAVASLSPIRYVQSLSLSLSLSLSMSTN